MRARLASGGTGPGRVSHPVSSQREVPEREVKLVRTGRAEGYAAADLRNCAGSKRPHTHAHLHFRCRVPNRPLQPQLSRADPYPGQGATHIRPHVHVLLVQRCK